MKGLNAIRSKLWWNAAGTRALKTAAQTAIAGLAAISAGATGVIPWEIDWQAIGGMVGMAALVSLLMSLAGIPEVDESEILAEVEKEFQKGE